MHLLEYDPIAKTVVEIPSNSVNRKPGCKYIQTESKSVEIPIVLSGNLAYVVWQHPDWCPPCKAKPVAHAEPASAPAAPTTSLGDALADTYCCSFDNTPTLIRAFRDWLLPPESEPDASYSEEWRVWSDFRNQLSQEALAAEQSAF